MGAYDVIDTCVHHRWPSQADVMEYLPAGWRSWAESRVRTDFLTGGAIRWRPIAPNLRYPNPTGDDLPAATADRHEALAEQLLGAGRAARALLVHDKAMMSPALANPRFASVVVRALNQWTIEHWLERDPRLFGAVLVASQQPGDAVEEIRRVGPHPQVAAVLLAANTIGKTFGHPHFHPIYEAASEHGLPVIIHRGGDSLVDQVSMPTAGGLPRTFGEYASLASEPLVSHVSNLISTGVFESYPDLRMYIVGGIAWVPGLLYRMELGWRSFRREVPWMRSSPEEYLRRHFRVSSYGVEQASRPGTTERLVRAFPAFEHLVCFGSGYPSWDAKTVGDIERLFPAQWHERILGGNAEKWFRWPSGSASRTGSGERGEIEQ